MYIGGCQFIVYVHKWASAYSTCAYVHFMEMYKVKAHVMETYRVKAHVMETYKVKARVRETYTVKAHVMETYKSKHTPVVINLHHLK